MSCANYPFFPPCHPANMAIQPEYMMPQPLPAMMMQNPYMYYHILSEPLQLMKEAIEGESEDRKFYEYLIATAPSEEEGKIISGIRDNEIKHFGMFRQIYYDLTGQMLPGPKDIVFNRPSNYCEGIKKAILGEQNAVQKYRKILFALHDRRQINMLLEIITDELRHGSLYNYLYARSECKT